MKKFKIINIEDTNYTLEDSKRKYIVNIIFYGEKKPKVNDIIYVSSKIIKEKNIYAYGDLNSSYSKNFESNEDDFIKIITDEEEYFLQRYYG